MSLSLRTSFSPKAAVRFGTLLAFLAAGPLLSGCSGVKPWERDLLAKPQMQLDADAIEAGYEDHTYFSKEASSGGRGFGGGGCGCN